MRLVINPSIKPGISLRAEGCPKGCKMCFIPLPSKWAHLHFVSVINLRCDNTLVINTPQVCINPLTNNLLSS